MSKMSEDKKELRQLIIQLLNKAKEFQMMLNINREIIKEFSKYYHLIIDMDNFVVVEWGELKDE